MHIEPFTGWLVIFNPDGNMMAMFVGDGEESVPTQHHAIKQYWDTNCSDLCHYEIFHNYPCPCKK